MKINMGKNSKMCDFGDIDIGGFFSYQGQTYLKLKSYWEDDNSYNVDTRVCIQLLVDSQVMNYDKKLTFEPTGTPFGELNNGDGFILDGKVCVSIGSSYYFQVENGLQNYLPHTTRVEKVDIDVIVNMNKNPDRFKESMAFVNMSLNVKDNKIPLIKALRRFVEDSGFTIGLKEAKDWVEDNCK